MDPDMSHEQADNDYAAGIGRSAAYPIRAFVRASMADRNVTRGRLPGALGYRNAAKALRHLDQLVEGREVPHDFLKRFIVALNVDENDLDAALAATRALQQEEAHRRQDAEIAAARAAFRPHLRVVPERSIPQPIFVAAFTGTAVWLREPIPEDVLIAPFARQLQIVGDLARAHYGRKKGRAGPFGAIQGYLFRMEFEKAIRLDIDGSVQGEHLGQVLEGRAYLKV